MLKFWLPLFTACSLIAADLPISDFRSDKILYDFGETAQFTATIRNPGDARTAEVRLILRHGVDQEISLPPQKIVLPAKGAETVKISYPVGQNEYGFAARLKADGAESETIIFEVCHDWRKINRAGGKPTYHGIFDPDFSDRQIEELIQFCRDWGYNRFHVFGSWMPAVDDFRKRSQPWNYWMAQEPNAPKNWKNTRISGEKIKEFIQRFHDNGIKVTMYFHTPTYRIPSEKWVVYDPLHPGKRQHYPGDRPARRAYLEKNQLGVPNANLFARDFSEKLAGAIQEYGWDGIFMDDFRRLVEYTEKGVDKNGKRLSAKSHGELHKEILETLVSRTKPVKDNFTFFLNGLHHGLYAIQNFPSRDMFGPNGEKFDEYPASSLDNFAYAGEWRDIQRQANSPWQLGRSLRAVRELTGTPLDIVWTIAVPPSHSKADSGFHGSNVDYTAREETVLPFTAVILANGLGYSEYYTGSPRDSFTDVRRNPLAASRAAYLKFAARYGQYLYDQGLRWTPRGEVHVEAPEHVYWKGNSFERKTASGREVVIHLINFDKPYLYAQLWDRERSTIPPVKAAEVSVKLRPGEICEGVYGATPDNGGDAVKLSAKMNGTSVTTRSPELKYWNMILFKIKDKKP